MHMIGKGEIRYTVFLAYPVRELLWLCKTCISRFISSPQMKATIHLALHLAFSF